MMNQPKKPSQSHKDLKHPATTGQSLSQLDDAETMEALEAELKHLRSIFRETIQAYRLSIEGEIAQIADPIKEACREKSRPMTKAQRKVLCGMILLIRQMDIRPEKGRRKDFKKFEAAVTELTSLAEKWQWTK
jgi:hypothetical protein